MKQNKTEEYDRLLRLGDVIGNREKGIIGLIPISKSAWYDGIDQGIYPKKANIDTRTALWRMSDILELIGR